MKKLYSILIAFIVCSCITVIRYPYYTITILDDNLYVDKYEVNYGAWLSYYSWTLKNYGEKKASKILPDSSLIDPLIWSLFENHSTDFNTQPSFITRKPIGYFNSKIFDSIKNSKKDYPDIKFNDILWYPVTGITFEQANDFCIWRTKVIGGDSIVYRLPSEKEWENIAIKIINDINQQKGVKDSVRHSLCRIFNYKITKPCDCRNSKPIAELEPGGRFRVNKIKIFDFFGNAAEMTSIKGIAKGGSYLHYASQSCPDSRQIYEEPEKWLGFRCVAEKK